MTGAPRNTPRQAWRSRGPHEFADCCKTRSTRSALVVAACRSRRRAGKYSRTSRCAILCRATKWRLCAQGRYVAGSAKGRGFSVDARRMRAHNELIVDNIDLPAVGQRGDCHAGTLLCLTDHRGPDPRPLAGSSNRALCHVACRTRFFRREGARVHRGTHPVQWVRTGSRRPRLELAPRTG